MDLRVHPDAEQLGMAAGRQAAALLRQAVQTRGTARLLLATGASQVATLATLVAESVPWDRVAAFHLDEYVGLGPDHPASFRRYLRERFSERVPLAAMHFLDTEGDLAAHIASTAAALLAAPVDVALVGIGENAHIAFNDPPADLTTREPFLLVRLAPECRAQQVREGWFPHLDAVPERAVTMSVHQILRSRALVSAVPYAVKAKAVRLALTAPVGPEVPASTLRTHPAWTLHLDPQSAAELPDGLRVTPPAPHIAP